jgi:hypothetical protein
VSGAGGALDAGAEAEASAGGGAQDGGAAPNPGASVLERNANPARTGHFVQPTLDRAHVTKMLLEKNYMALFAGDVWASPLYLERGPGGRGAFFVVTTANQVLAIDELTGSTLWATTIGPSPVSNGVPCGDIHPLGILGTPLIDAASRTIYVAGAIGTSTIARHEVHALSVEDGQERAGWPVDVGKSSGGAFDAPSQNQRAAVSLVGGILYVAYGGHAAGCGNYRGWVFAIDTARPTSAVGWSTNGAGDGIDAPGGMASDGTGVFAVTGQSASDAPSHLDDQEVLHLTGLSALSRDDANVFVPASWRSMDMAGADLGASSPMLLEIPGSPTTYVVVLSGDGHMYLLDRERLGGMGGQVVDFQIAAGAMSIRTAPTTYTTSQGTYVALTAASGVTCPLGSPAPPAGNSGQVVVSVLIEPGAPPKPKIAWCYYLITGQGSPVSTTTDGRSDPIVWFMNDVKLLGLDGDTGHEVYDGTHDISGIPFADRTCPGVHAWTSPIAVKGRMVVAAGGRLCTWAPQ